MDGKEFLQVCHDYQNATEESKRRTAVSRGYYAVFNSIVEFFDRSGISLSRGPSAHGQIASYLLSASDVKAQTIGSQVGDLKGDRNEADYDMASTKFNQSTTALLVKKAEIMLHDFDSLNKKTLLVDVKAYQKKISKGT